MFYSHEFLTSREHGVATIWVVATLGAKSALKKVKRKSIVEVNVSKACESFISPEIPLALRLQSNLLYGVTQVYSEQCGFVLLDAHQFSTSLRESLRRGNVEIDLPPEAIRGSRKQLLLEDDPTFLPGLASFDFDIDLFGPGPVLQPQSLERSRSLSPFSSQNDGGKLELLDIPLDSSGMEGAIGSFAVKGDDGSGMNVSRRPESLLGQSDHGLLLDAPFAFDEFGNLYNESDGLEEDLGFMETEGRQLPLGSDTGFNARVHEEHEEGRVAPSKTLDGMDIDNPLIMGDGLALPPVEEVSAPEEASTQLLNSSDPSLQEGISTPENRAVALQNRARSQKFIQMDAAIQLRNSDIARWNTDYLRDMAVVSKQKLRNKKVTQAKKNAEWLIWGRGIANVGYGIGSRELKTPLHMFCGESLYQLVTGKPQKSVPQKRAAPDQQPDGTPSSGRRVRSRTKDSTEQILRGGEPGGGMDFLASTAGGENYTFVGGDQEVEAPRAASRELDNNLSSAMPWHYSGSVPTSIARSIAGSGARHHRTISASPLLGRGPAGTARLSGLPSVSGSGAGLDEDIEAFSLGVGGFGDGLGTLGSENVRGGWGAAALDGEWLKFLSFVEQGIQEKRRKKIDLHEEEEVDGAGEAEITFEELLPPAKVNRIVACQGLVHVLSLGTKGLLEVHQARHYGAIEMRFVVASAE